MLSRIARGLYEMGRLLERAQNVIRILEVNHKMYLERESIEDGNVWSAIAEAFSVDVLRPDESALYGELVFSDRHPDSVLACIREARERGRAMRDHISEEMWLLLNGYYLDFREATFADVLRSGRTEFNRQVELFCDGFHGLAASTMNHGAPWHFLRTGRYLERGIMIGRILDIKQKSLLESRHEAGRPLDVHQWQTLLRSVSGYEPYRRAHDARIAPDRVLEFVLKSQDFPRSLHFSLTRVANSLRRVASHNPAQAEAQLLVDELLADLRRLDCSDILETGALEPTNQTLIRRCAAFDDAIVAAFFGSLRPTPAPIAIAAGATQVPQ